MAREYQPTSVHAGAGYSTRALLLLLAAAYCLTLEYAYVEVVSPRYSYAGLRSTQLDFLQHAFSLGLVTLCASFVPIALTPSAVLCFVLYVHLVIPLSFLTFHLDSLTEGESYFLPLVVAGNFLLLCALTKYQKPIVMRPPRIGPHFAIGLIVFLGLATIALRLYLFDHFDLNANLYDVYDRRLAGRQVVGTRNVSAYVISIGTTVAGLAMIAVGAVRRIHSLWILGVIIYLLAFITIGSKAALFFPPALFTALFLLKSAPKHFMHVLLACLSLLNIVAVFEVQWLGTYVVSGMLVRRELTVPGAITVGYYDFFSSNPKYFYSDSVLRWFADSPYAVSKSFLIGRYATGNPETNANANLWASGYADAGFAGMLVATYITSLIARILNGMKGQLGIAIPVLAALAIGFKLSQSPIERALVGHGGLALLGFLYLLQSGNLAGRRAKRALPIGLDGSRRERLLTSTRQPLA